MPGATSAVLGTAFKKEKARLKTQVLIWPGVFFAVLAFLIGFGAWTVWGTGQAIDIAVYSRGLLRKLPLYVPLVWFALYANKRRSECNRLRQEYIHKETVAASYGSCKEQIKEIKEEGSELLESLLKHTLGSVAYNPSETLDRKHGDKTPIGEVLSNMRKLLNIPNMPGNS